MKTFYDRLCLVEAWIARVFLVAMVLLIFAAAIARLMAHPINWAVDVATALFAWACLFAADVAWRNNRLMAVEVVTNFLSDRGKAILRMVNYAVLTAFLLYAIPAGLWLSWVSRERSFQGIPDFSYSWVTMAMPVGAVLLLVTTMLKVRADLAVLRSPPARPQT
jgi:TRAP-type C4-dicarboxylate transport system permease small subunit